MWAKLSTHWFAGCGMLVAGGFCYRMLVDDGESLVSRRIHRTPARASDRLLSIERFWSPTRISLMRLR